MVLLINILVLLIAFRLLFEKKVIDRLMMKRWNNLINIQHIIFFVLYGIVTIYSVLYFIEMPFALYRIVFILLLNLVLYYICYSHLVPAYYETNKYSEYILYALILFIVSSLLRMLIEPVLPGDFDREEQNNAIFLISIYGSQSIIILVASFLGISKHKFIIESEYKDLEYKKTETDLNLMKSKVNPHFLLNTLNNIYANSYSENSASAEAIMQLSQLLQYVIYETDKKRIAISKEFQMIKALAGLYQLKYNNQLSIVFEIEGDDILDQIEIPPSIYFTLFENALKHSSMGDYKDAFIKIIFKTEGDVVIFQTINSISEKEKDNDEYGYNGMGMVSLKKILTIEYAKNYELIVQESNKTYFSTLKIKL
ncbi:sensor histidine kinase [Flavobacterium sp. '19STA2R22 D10 B1']|uniref:sensor histidine kinase n=1 Tax=Flavobacterium aerium TaxID=3037261 RepID=UPI00278C3CB6|nr:histidine kinase [Flavobacterium sp. '19STA2R22 D10 B1']